MLRQAKVKKGVLIVSSISNFLSLSLQKYSTHFHLSCNVFIVIERLLSAWLTSVITAPQEPEQVGMIAKNGVGSNFLIQYSCVVPSDDSTVTQPPPGVLNLLLIVSGD